MNDQTPFRMPVEEFLSWAPTQAGRWELIDGRPIKRPSETFGHIDVKFFVCLALKELVEGNDQLHVLSDGATVRIDAHNANQPDALIYSGPKRPGSAIEPPDPLVVVEVVSPSSGRRGRIRKREDCFSLPSVEHYLVIDPDERTLCHFDRASWRGDGRLLGEGDTAALTPPGLHLPVRRCFQLR